MTTQIVSHFAVYGVVYGVAIPRGDTLLKEGNNGHTKPLKMYIKNCINKFPIFNLRMKGYL
jgi:hypothetical protein